jgi:type IV secretion system protein TrbD
MAARRETQFERALIQPRLIMGVEWGFALVNGILAYNMVMNLKIWWFIAISVLIHMVLRFVSKRDPMMRQVYIRYNRQHDRYDPWPRVKQRYNHRPDGMGKGMLC